MTDIVTPPLIDELPAAPLPTDTEEQHDQKAYAMVGAMVAMVPQINAATASAEQNALAAQEHAQSAAQAAAQAAGVQDAMWGATGFKGVWEDLSGPLSFPATVKDGGRFWLLLRDIDAIEDEKPGESDVWTSLDAGTLPQQIVSSGTVAAIAGVMYVIAGPEVTITAPPAPLHGDAFSVRLAADVSGTQIVDFGSIPVRGQIAGQRYIDTHGFGLDLVFNGFSGGWV